MDSFSIKEIVEKYGEMVFNICFKFISNEEDAKDLTQEVFIEIHRSIPNFRKESGISTWIYKIAVNRSLDELKKKKRKEKLQGIKNLFIRESEYLKDSLTPQSIIEEKDRWKVINKALNSIPERQRIAITLYRIESLPLSEIAGIMNIEKSAVEMLIYRAKLNLKKILYKHFEKLF